MKAIIGCAFTITLCVSANVYADQLASSGSPASAAPSDGNSSAMPADVTSSRELVQPPPPPEPVVVAHETAIPPNVMAAMRVSPMRLAVTEYLVGLGAAAITVPLTFALGTYLGSLSNDLVGAALPPLLLFTLVPSFAVTGAEVIAGNMLIPGVASMHPAIWPAVATSVTSIALGAVSGVSLRNAVSFSLFSLAVSAVLPAGVTLVLHATRPRWAVDAQRRHARRPADQMASVPMMARESVFDARRLEDPYAMQTFMVPLAAGVF